MAADSKIVSAPDTVSPKVFWPLVVGLGLTFVATFLAAVTPEMLSVLGPFAVPMATSLVSVAGVITGWLKSDHLRVIGSEATAAILPVAPTSQVTPPLPLADEPLTPTAERAEPDDVEQLEAELAQLDRNPGGGSTAA
ncbi:hypothetical protein [Kocuria sp. UBA1838]|uniref:hypothetical protein n=1 Tax=Kocuria sp. UBA1838 TaxID=1946673 RepID=UPI002580E746|nr:hypothetical protein [Kocuria sp. UBA1838]